MIFVKIIKLDIAACQAFTTYYIKNYQLCLDYNSLTHSTKFYSGSQYVSHGRFEKVFLQIVWQHKNPNILKSTTYSEITVPYVNW